MSLLSFIRLHIINRAYNSHYHKSNSEYQRNRPLTKGFSRSGNDDVWMAEQADLILCYIERESGGAYKAVQYARKLGKEVINLAEETKED